MRVPTFILAILATSCASYRFVKTDPAFTAVERKELPLVCLHETPPAFRSVGLIEWVGPQDVSPEDLMAEAAGAGKKLGCDVVVSTELTAAGRLLSRGIVLVHGEGGDPTPQSDPGSRGATNGGTSRDTMPRKIFRFHCGILMPAHGV